MTGLDCERGVGVQETSSRKVGQRLATAKVDGMGYLVAVKGQARNKCVSHYFFID